MPLTSLNLDRNHVRNEGASALGLSLQRNSSMQHVRLAFNGIREAGAIALAVALKSNDAMETADLRGNRFPFVRLKLAAMLAGCPRAVELLHD